LPGGNRGWRSAPAGRCAGAAAGCRRGLCRAGCGRRRTRGDSGPAGVQFAQRPCARVVSPELVGVISGGEGALGEGWRCPRGCLHEGQLGAVGGPRGIEGHGGWPRRDGGAGAGGRGLVTMYLSCQMTRQPPRVSASMASQPSSPGRADQR